MNKIIKDASDGERDAHRREIAHEHSARWHRKVGVRLGIASTVLSTIVSTSVFASIAKYLGLNGKGTLTIPQEFLPLLLFYGIVILLILSPVLSAVLTYLNEPDQVAKHTSASADYYLLKERLGMFISKYENVDFTDETRRRSEKELEELSIAMAKLRKESIQLTPRALRGANEEINSTHTSSSEA